MEANSELVHKIDRELAVLTALFEEHADQTAKHDENQEKKLEAIQKDLASLKIKVAGVSSLVSVLVFKAAQWLGEVKW